MEIPLDIIQVLQVLTNAPMTLILLYLLMKEQNAHQETRAKAREVELDLYNRTAALAERVISAIDKLHPS